MGFTTISSSNIAKFNRMDAGFHIAVSAVADRVSELEAILTTTYAVERLIVLHTEDLACLEPLTTGNSASKGRDALIRAIEAYPLIAYALVERNMAASQLRASAAVSAAESYASALSKLKLD